VIKVSLAGDCMKAVETSRCETAVPMSDAYTIKSCTCLSGHGAVEGTFDLLMSELSEHRPTAYSCTLS
jgi:hypothetical protein